MNLVSSNLRNPKNLNVEAKKDEDLINKCFNYKPLIIKTQKQSASLSDNKKMKKKNLLPFTNSFGTILNDVYKKAHFLKGSLDYIYPKIIVKKFYEDKKKALIKKAMQKEYERKKTKLLTEKYYILKDDEVISPTQKEHNKTRNA